MESTLSVKKAIGPLDQIAASCGVSTLMIMKRTKFMAIWCSLFFVGSLSGCAAQKNSHISDVVLIPKGYVGWVTISYGVRGHRPIATTNGIYNYHIPSSGSLITSSNPSRNTGYEVFKYVKGKYTATLDVSSTIWQDSFGSPIDGGQRVSPIKRSFFVGTQTESELADQFNAPVGWLDPAALQAWRTGRDLSYKDLSGRNFYQSNLKGANLLSSILKNTDLRGSDLSYAALGSNLTNANLEKANLYGANLREAVVIGANLQHCDLRKAHLQGVDLSRAKLLGANVFSAQYDSRTKWPRSFNGGRHGAILKAVVSAP